MKTSLVCSFVLSVVAWLACTASVLAADAESKVDLRAAPSLKGRKAEEAVQVARLAGLNLLVGKFYIAPQHWRDDIRPGAVYMQTPQPGSALSPGSQMAGWVFEKAAADRPIVKTPDLKNESLASATKRLIEAELPILSDLSLREGVVVDQYPRPGQAVYVGTSVFVVLKTKEKKN